MLSCIANSVAFPNSNLLHHSTSLALHIIHVLITVLEGVKLHTFVPPVLSQSPIITSYLSLRLPSQKASFSRRAAIIAVEVLNELS